MVGAEGAGFDFSFEFHVGSPDGVAQGRGCLFHGERFRRLGTPGLRPAGVPVRGFAALGLERAGAAHGVEVAVEAFA